MTPYYDDGTCVIYHGDCREMLPWASTIGLVVTSPPYNLGRSLDDTPNEAMHNRGRPSWDRGYRNQRLTDGYDAYDDALPLAEYRRFQREVLARCWACLGDAGAIYYNHKPRVQRGRTILPTEYIPEGVLLRQVIIWDRVTKGMAFVPQAYNTGHEWILLLAKPAFCLKSRSASAASDIWRAPPEVSFSGHPCPFPLAIPAMAIATASFSGPVLDPFMGSGTTLRAAKDAGVRAIGIDTSERYCEIAARRLGQEVLPFGDTPPGAGDTMNEPLMVAEMNDLGAVLLQYLDATKWREHADAVRRRRDDPDDVVLRRRALCRRICIEGLWGNG